MKFITFLLFLAIGSGHCSKEYFSSLQNLKEAYQKEGDLLRYLKEYRSGLQSQLDRFKKDIKNFKLENEKAGNDAESYFGHPINTFHTIKRLYVDFKDIGREISENKVFENFKHKVENIIDNEEYPTDEDLSGSAMALARVQDTYNLHASDLASGLIAGVKTPDSMSWDDCFYVSQQLYEVGNENRTQEWLIEALNKFYPKITDDEDSVDILESMANITIDLRDVDTTLNITETILKVQPDHLIAQSANVLMKSLPKNYKDMMPKPEYNPSYWLTPEDFRTYEAVCRDEIYQTPRETKDLFCMYTSYNNPFLKLAPFKLEVLNKEPLIVIYHDVLYDSETEFLKQQALPLIRRSTIGVTTEDKGSKANLRTSHGTFIEYKGVPQLENLIQRVEDMTRQNIQGSEQIQVATYGMGGHYEPHYDCFGDKIGYSNWKQDGDRISTAMFYASDVELGGSTSFPKLSLNVKPRKGSMVFWYNLHTSGKKDFRSLHAGCPVIKGSKWIFNIWMRLNPQMLHRKCELQDDSWKSKQFSYIRG